MKAIIKLIIVFIIEYVIKHFSSSTQINSAPKGEKEEKLKDKIKQDGW